VVGHRYFAQMLAIAAPAALLGGAYISQYGFGLSPCQMCLWQRWPHMAAIALGLGAWMIRGRPQSWWLVLAAAIAIAISGAIGAFHAGVEYDWWEGLTDCAVMTEVQPGSVLNSGITAPVMRCDEAPWDLMGISLAGFNALFSLGAAALIFMAIRRASHPAL
jgi:disulfide bond formation protein DsbB